MTAFIAEARRLGIDTSLTFPMPEESRRPGVHDAEGLCITGCPSCRAFRNEVRAALEAERAELVPQFTVEDMDGAFNAGFIAGMLASREAYRRWAEDFDDSFGEAIREQYSA